MGDMRPRDPAPPSRRAAAIQSSLRRYPKHLLAAIRAFGQKKSGPRVPVGACPPMEGHALAALWLGHATVLLRIGGRTILTDPVFSHRVGLSLGALTLGPERLFPTPLTLEQLPAVDLILLSHAHFDHLDKPTLRRLVSQETAVITARHTAKLVPRGFGEVIELDWDKEQDVAGLRIGAIKPSHWGARTALDRHRRFNSYLIAAAEAAGQAGHRVLFAGDTAHTEAFDHLGDVKLAIFGIGAYEPWVHAHATPEQAWSMFTSLGRRVGAGGGPQGGEHLLPVHHATFPLGDEHPDEPMQRLLAVAGADAHRIVARRAGDLWTAA
jgi:L-ascorbate metabolism protein UlaG (beta-lactamase superfamily)